MERTKPAAQSSFVSRRLDAFVRSEVFARHFKEGMALVERTANYLDGEGREVSRSLPRHTALAYASASMRVTTLLMQSASWLLVLRAVRDGELGVEEATDEKYRLSDREAKPARLPDGNMPAALLDIIAGSEKLYDRLQRLDCELFAPTPAVTVGPDLLAQIKSLHDAFGQS